MAIIKFKNMKYLIFNIKSSKYFIKKNVKKYILISHFKS